MGSNITYGIVLCLALSVEGRGYEIPDVTIEVNKPKGFTASIPDAPGIGIFSFNANLNSAITNPDIGSFSGEVLEATGGRWVFRDDQTVLKKGDKLQYWVMVSVNSLGYIKDNLVFEYNGDASVPDTTNRAGTNSSQCIPSLTKVGDKNACSGQVIFEENFNQPSNKWQFEQKIPTAHPEYPFVSYQNSPTAIKIIDGKLRITPSLLQNESSYSSDSIRSGTLDLFRGCTEAADSCSITASGYDILPPVISGRASTKYTFTFKYGIVDIRAKLPKGDWLYPELLLEPYMNRYGLEHFSSGVVKIAMSRGNLEVRNGQSFIGNVQLSGGVALDHLSCHDKLFVTKTSGQYWSSDYHTYSVRWDPDGFTWSVDSVEYGSIQVPAGGFREKLNGCPGMRTVFERWATGSKIAPFDEEFYLTLGLAAGGITVFPDGSVTSLGRNKPWNNRASKAKLHFWQALDQWYPTWSEDSSIQIDSVTVRAL